MSYYDDMHYHSPEHGISGWGYLPTEAQQKDRDHLRILELEDRGFRLYEILEVRRKDVRLNWRFGDPEVYMETHWMMFEPGFVSEQDETITTTARERIDKIRSEYGRENVKFVNPTERMVVEADFAVDYPHPLIGVMVRQSQMTS